MLKCSNKKCRKEIAKLTVDVAREDGRARVAIICPECKHPFVEIDVTCASVESFRADYRQAIQRNYVGLLPTLPSGKRTPIAAVGVLNYLTAAVEGELFQAKGGEANASKETPHDRQA